jgi:preprotein translocase subunit SecG
MQIWTNLVLVVQLVSAIAMIGLVLVQHGKGADMGASFGSGSSGSLFGATGSANFLSRSTAVCATVFFLSTLSLVFMNSHRTAKAPTAGTSVLDRAATGASAPPAGAVIPGAGMAPAVPAPAAPAASSAAPGTIPTK